MLDGRHSPREALLEEASVLPQAAVTLRVVRATEPTMRPICDGRLRRRIQFILHLPPSVVTRKPTCKL